MTQTLLTLICPPSLERTVTDWLLEQESITGFTSIKTHGHGSDPHTLNLIEQVEGRKKQITFQIQLSSEKTDVIIKDLKQNLKGTKIHYWLLPVLDSGCL